MTTTVHSPTVGRRRLRSALRQARDTVGLTQEQVAEHMDWSLSKVIRIETGGVGISTSDLRQLLLLYQIADPEQVASLVELAKVGRQRPWWTRYKDTVPGGYLAYIGLEDESSALRCVSPSGLPGLLQTEEFSHALANAGWWSNAVGGRVRRSPPAAERVDVRMIRQREVLHRATPPEISAILDEAVLWREIGGRAVLQRQLLHLVALGSGPHVSIRVLPFHAGKLYMQSPFVILEFPDPADPEVVYAESDFENTIIDDPAEVTIYRQVFEDARGASLSEGDSLAMIARVAGKISDPARDPGRLT